MRNRQQLEEPGTGLAGFLVLRAGGKNYGVSCSVEDHRPGDRTWEPR